MRIVVLRAKGGVGGSSITLSLSKYFALIGKKVLLVDRDAISTASSFLGIGEFGLIQLIKKGESYEKAIAKINFGKGSITALKIFSDGVPIEFEREDLIKNEDKISEAYGKILRNGNFDIIVVDTMAATTPLEVVTGWEFNTYLKYYSDKIKYIMVSDLSKPSIEGSIRYFNVLKENGYIKDRIDVALLNKVDFTKISQSETISKLVDFMDSMNSEIGIVIPYYPIDTIGRNCFEKIGVPTQIMELGNYFLRKSKGREIFLPSPFDPIKRMILSDTSVLIKGNQGNAEESVRATSRILMDVYRNSKIFIFTSLNIAPYKDAIVFKSIYSFLTERVKVKTLDDGIRLAKKLASEITEEMRKQTFEKGIIFFFPAEDIEPLSNCCDRYLLSKIFWNELLSQLMSNFENISIAVICDPRKADCVSIEGLVDIVIDAKEEGGEVKYTIEYSKVPWTL
ncbi:MAG: AAA family ATPase [Fervidicoccaceae archaeon]